MSRRFGWGRRYTLDATDRDPAQQSFIFRLFNAGGTQLQHAIASVGSSPAVLGDFSWKISGASPTFQNTPVISNVVGFGGVGVGILGGGTIIFDTVAQFDTDFFSAPAAIEFNNTLVSNLVPRIRLDSSNVAGVTIPRLSLFVSDNGTGATLTLTAGTLAANSELRIRVGPIALR